MSVTNWTKPGCRSLELDEPIQQGDYVAECWGEDRSTGTPGNWVRAIFSVGQTPRDAHVFACRPIGKQTKRPKITCDEAFPNEIQGVWIHEDDDIVDHKARCMPSKHEWEPVEIKTFPSAEKCKNCHAVRHYPREGFN